VNDRAYTLHRWWWHWWRDMRFDSYVKKDKLSSYVCFVLTDQNTISEFLTNTVSITLHQNKHFTQTNTLLHDIHLYNHHLYNIHLYIHHLYIIISTIHSSLQSSSLQYIYPTISDLVNKQHLSLQSFYLYKISISTLSSFNKTILTKLSQQSYLDKAISTKICFISHF
jgi:hypothetical protein